MSFYLCREHLFLKTTMTSVLAVTQRTTPPRVVRVTEITLGEPATLADSMLRQCVLPFLSKWDV